MTTSDAVLAMLIEWSQSNIKTMLKPEIFKAALRTSSICFSMSLLQWLVSYQALCTVLTSDDAFALFLDIETFGLMLAKRMVRSLVEAAKLVMMAVWDRQGVESEAILTWWREV